MSWRGWQEFAVLGSIDARLGAHSMRPPCAFGCKGKGGLIACAGGEGGTVGGGVPSTRWCQF